MTEVEGETNDWIRPHANTCLTGVGLGAPVAVITGRPVHLRLHDALVRHLVAHPVGALVAKSGAIHRRPWLTDPVRADVVDRAKTAIVAWSRVVDV
jgi:hypothetical protein